MHDKPVRLQRPDRFAHRSAADAKAGCQLRFGQAAAGRQRARADLGDEAQVGILALTEITDWGRGFGHTELRTCIMHPVAYSRMQS